MTGSAAWYVERASHWLAARSSRRSFLGRASRVAMLVAGGPTLAGFLTNPAEARVCGQSGVSPKCPTYDCVGENHVWGWCWYASRGECCAGGGLKKICDCCVTNWPNVHGYCPSGTNVKCIVESCWSDPRVQTVSLTRVGDGSAWTAALAVSKGRFADGGAPAVVIGDGDDPMVAGVAAAMAGAVRRPFLLSPRDRLPTPVVEELRRLGATNAAVVGPALGPAVEGYLLAIGMEVERIGGTDAPSTSLAAAQWVRERTATDRAFCVATPDAVAASAAGAAAVQAPLLIGADAAVAFGAARTYTVGPGAPDVPGGYALDGATVGDVARVVGNAVTIVEGRRAVALAAAPEGVPGAVGLAGVGGVLLLHPGGVLDPENAQWVRDHQAELSRGWCAGGNGTLADRGYYELQSALNHYDAHLLIGVSGQGLPVISQPLAEREIGRARLAGSPPTDLNAGYWVGRANPDRR